MTTLSAELGVPSAFSHELYAVDSLTGEYQPGRPDRHPTTDKDEAQVVSSEVAGTGGLLHTILLDLDVPAKLIPSSTPGHSHLYIDVALSWEAYERLLSALADAGVIERGYYNASKVRGATFLRLPHVKKEVTE